MLPQPEYSLSHSTLTDCETVLVSTPVTWLTPSAAIPKRRAVSSATVTFDWKSSSVLAPEVAAASAATCIWARTRSTFPRSITSPAMAMITTMKTAIIGSVWPASLRRDLRVGVTHSVIDSRTRVLS